MTTHAARYDEPTAEGTRRMTLTVARTVELRIFIAKELTTITGLYPDLETEALHHASDAELPGGDPLVMVSPSADLDTWESQVEAAEAEYFLSLAEGRDATWLAIEDNDDLDPPPPLLVLAWWEDRIRTARNDFTENTATVQDAAAYIRSALDWILRQDDDGTPRFPDVIHLYRDLVRLRKRMEAMLKAGEQVDRGVPCMNCGATLEKQWADSADENDDRWHCPRCKQWSTLDQYRAAVNADYRRNSDRLTATDMELEYRVKRGTLSAWVTRGQVRKRGRDGLGRMMYDVNDTLTMRDASETDTSGVDSHGRKCL